MQLLKKSFAAIFSNKKILTLSIAPVCVTLMLYVLGAIYLFAPLFMGIEALVLSLIPLSLGIVAHYTLLIIFGIGFYFFFSWTIVALVSVLAWPFNRKILAIIDPVDTTSRHSFIQDLFNEVQKMAIILLIALLNFSLALVPILSIIAIGITGLLIAWQFLDYSWSHHQMKLGECINHLKKSLWSYLFHGLIFLVLSAIPIINLLIPAWATIHFNQLFNLQKAS